MLGSCLLRPTEMAGLGLDEEDFSTPGHQAIWSALSAMALSGGRVDIVRLRSALLDAGRLEVAGGEVALGLLRYVAKPSLLPIDRLKQLARMRKMRAAAELVVATCQTGDLDASVSSLGDAHATAMGSVQRKRTQNVLELCMGLLDELSSGKSDVARIHPGYEILEQHLGSIPVGCTVAILASTNVGKSGYALEMLIRAAQRNVCSGYLSVEDQEPLVRARIVGALSGVSSRKILLHRLERGDMERITHAYGELDRLKGHLHTSILQGGSDADVCAAMSDLAARGVKLLVVDYLQKISSSRTYQSKAHEVSSSATRITSHAQRLGVVCVLVSQCTRDKTRLNECPSKHDMKESGDLENMVDAIVGLWRESEDDFAPVWARLLKVKSGGVGQSWRLQRNRDSGRLEEVPDSDKQEPPDTMQRAKPRSFR